jgi:hypothetical protein
MAILSKLVSGLASVVTNKALYVAGIIVLTLAKPACDYTVKLILRDTSVALADTESSIENTIRVAFEDNQKILRDTLANKELSIKDALAENQKILQEYICTKIDEVNQFTMNEIEGMNTQVSILMNMMKEIKTNQSIILNAIGKNNNDIVNRIINDLEKSFAEMQMQLPDKDYIESTTKKYAMFLHDEHVEIMNISRDDDTISIASSVQAIPTPKEVPVPRLGPIKFAPPPLSGVPKLRKPLSARSVN